MASEKMALTQALAQALLEALDGAAGGRTAGDGAPWEPEAAARRAAAPWQRQPPGRRWAGTWEALEASAETAAAVHQEQAGTRQRPGAQGQTPGLARDKGAGSTGAADFGPPPEEGIPGRGGGAAAERLEIQAVSRAFQRDARRYG